MDSHYIQSKPRSCEIKESPFEDEMASMPLTLDNAREEKKEIRIPEFRKGQTFLSAMAGVLTVATSSAAVCRRRSFPANNPISCAISSSKCYPSGSWNLLRRSTTVLPSRRLVIRAARTESKGASLGFRAPDFEVC